MGKQTLFALLFILFAFTSCDKKCSSVDCIVEPFVFKLTNAEGVNLLDDGSVKLEQLYIATANAMAPLVRVATIKYGDETWLEAAVNSTNSNYTLNIEGYRSQNLSFAFDVRTGECCTSVTIKEVHLDSKPLPESHFGRTVILP
ncbi:hypothetical protein [Pontibacter sp. H249]|uniref:hypothetical protein n=1 Tax=Pontibacter sp. H249 TaxID=3133420 RepID=UPI0030C2EAC2